MGFIKETNSEDYMGWISLEKRKQNHRINQIFSEKERPDLILEQVQIAERPYVLEIFELKKSAYNSDDKLPEDDDYRLADVFYFKTLNDVNSFLKKYNKNLDDAKWIAEIPSL